MYSHLKSNLYCNMKWGNNTILTLSYTRSFSLDKPRQSFGGTFQSTISNTVEEDSNRETVYLK